MNITDKYRAAYDLAPALAEALRQIIGEYDEGVEQVLGSEVAQFAREALAKWDAQ